ncbi:MAG: multiheme c-type cytochrome, partial [Woeseiaceae bacterium]
TLAFAFAGCEGDTGPQGPAGPAGADGADGADGQDGLDGGDATAQAAQLESCATCHSGAGDGHQSLYDPHTSASEFGMTFDAISSVAGAGGGFDFTLDFSITMNGAPYIDPVGAAPSVDSFSVYIVEYDSTTGEFPQQFGGFPGLDTSLAASNGDGTYTLTQNFAVDPVALAGGAIVGRIADGPLDIADATAPRMQMYENLVSASFAIGDIATYDSVATVDGCVACHNAPYRKHGNLEVVVAGVPDFVQCWGCHSVDSDGGHPEWQHMVDNPLAWANGDALTAEEETLYAYQRTLMNDVHMSHAMEFPYPQSMQNCNTCHAGKLTEVLADTNFTGETCQSCHPVRGIDTWPDELYEQPHRAPALDYLWQRGADLTFHDITSDCQSCHGAGVSQSLTAYHTGYDVNIADDTGQKYADLYTVSIDQVTMAGDLMTVNFSSNDPAIVPELLVSFYGWDSKHFIVGSHERDANPACTGFRPGCKMEYVPESSGGDPNPLFTEDAASAPGAWVVTLDVSALQLTKTDDIPTLIADGVIRKAEIGVTPELNLADLATPGPDVDVVLMAADQTYEIGSNQLVDDYFKDANATVSIDKCNACHDSLASSFHAESGRGGDGIEVCKHCHTTTFPGSHLEMASRSIDSYVHAIHSFQDFDVDDVFNDRDADGNPIPGFDPVFTTRYDHHIRHTFPHFTITNCESCHVAGTFNVPDQSQSMPGVLQTSFAPLTWYEIVDDVAVEDSAGRNLSSSIPEFVTGPASRACGACHRAEFINADLQGDLTSFNAHTDSFGTFAENDEPDDAVLFQIIEDIMELFE